MIRLLMVTLAVFLSMFYLLELWAAIYLHHWRRAAWCLVVFLWIVLVVNVAW